jgi:alpha-galactosidase
MKSMGNLLTLTLFLFTFLVASTLAMDPMQNSKRYQIERAERDFRISELDNAQWQRAKPLMITTYWSGEQAPSTRHFVARMLWTRRALYFKCEANQGEPLVIAQQPKTDKKAFGLWGRDVCELFIAPERDFTNIYYEFEVAPTGEWIDIKIDFTGEERRNDWDYVSGMQAAGRIEEGRVIMAFRVEWKAFDKTPRVGDIWMGNIFRAVGAAPERGYLAWQPTMTAKPDFHVPAKFGEFEFMR